MSQYQFSLEKGSRRFVCPSCEKKRFVRYVDNQSGEYLPEEYGRCDREVKCQYHLNPYKSGYAQAKFPYQSTMNSSFAYTGNRGYTMPSMQRAKPTVLSKIPHNSLTNSRNRYESNNLCLFLNDHFDRESVIKAIIRYQIGTSDHWPGSTIFWQIDNKGEVRSGKIIQYNKQSGRRIKSNQPPVYWVHSMLGNKEFHLEQCLFGEHLLHIYPDKSIGLVESEKSAVIASIYFPKILWLATGGKSNLNIKLCKPLQGRRVIVFPDVGAFEEWAAKIKKIAATLGNLSITTSQFLEKNCTEEERSRGADIADIILRRSRTNKAKTIHDTIKKAIPAPKELKRNQSKKTFGLPISNREPILEDWDVYTLIEFFKNTEIPYPIVLDPVTKVGEWKWIDAHIKVVQANQGNKGYRPYYDRLVRLMEYLISDACQ